MATEKRLIDANTLKRHMIKAFELCGLNFITKNDVVYCIDNTDTVDAVEVVHGRWGYEGFDIYRCSNCGACSHVKEVMGKPDWDYCPNCGAKMDGDGNA